ncbi:MAG: DNA adenine methylase [Lachnospiraceae bacterium]|nr:DNA adenine methylase [Lachnospiraceae bacterium]
MSKGLLNGYIGSKDSFSWEIRALFDKNSKKYIEPYAGGAGVYFSLPNGAYEKEWLNDQNPCVAILYQVISDEETRTDVVKRIISVEKPDDVSEAKRLYGEAQEKVNGLKCLKVASNLKDVLDSDQIIDMAVSSFIVYSQSFNKAGRGYSDLMSNDVYQAVTRENLISSINRLKTLNLATNMDAGEIIKKKKDDSSVQFYLDPPYVGVSRANKGKNYGYDMISLREHYELACKIRDSKAAVVLSGYRAPQQGVPTIYDAVLRRGWHCYQIGETQNKAQVVEKGSRKAVVAEYVWTNRVPDEACHYISLEDYKENLTVEKFIKRTMEAIEDGRITDKKDVKDYFDFKNYYMKKWRDNHENSRFV